MKEQSTAKSYLLPDSFDHIRYVIEGVVMGWGLPQNWKKTTIFAP